MYNYYDVYDMKREKIIIRRARARELAKMFHKPSNYFANAAEVGTTIQGRYKMIISFIREWEDVTNNLKRYPDVIKNIRIAEGIDL